MHAVIDLNCDLGEGASYDAALMPFITSASIACGAHAGDAVTMRETVQAALRHGVAIGAHPGFADRAQFGRRELALSPHEIGTLVYAQVMELKAIALSEGARVTYVKPHGALYNMAARERIVADAVAEAVARVDAGLWLYGLAGGQLLVAGRARGLRVASEAFVDRTYQADGSLTPRTQSGAVITDVADAVAQAVRLIRERKVLTNTGSAFSMTADTLCLHGDGSSAVSFARDVHTALRREGVPLRPLAS